LEKTTGGDESVSSRSSIQTSEGVDGVGKGINGISVVEGLSTEGLVKDTITVEGGAVVNVTIGLNNPDELLARVVEVELDLVGGRANRFISSELELLNQVLVRVLGELSALISIEEDIVDVERGSNKGLLVSHGGSLGTRSAGKGADGPEALTNRTEINVNLDFMVLQGNERQSQTRVSAEPKEEGDVKGGFGKSLTGGADLRRTTSGSAGTSNISEARIGDIDKLSGMANHLEVALLLLGGKGELVPDVHGVTILAVNSLATNLNLNLSNELLTGEVQPTSM
jgi:hypothetical protein